MPAYIDHHIPIDALRARAGAPAAGTSNALDAMRLGDVDAATNESVRFAVFIPDWWVAASHVALRFSCTSDDADGGDVRLQVYYEAVANGEALPGAGAFPAQALAAVTETIGATGVRTALFGADWNIPGAAVAAGDLLVIEVHRNVAHVADTLAGDLYILDVNVQMNLEDY